MHRGLQRTMMRPWGEYMAMFFNANRDQKRHPDPAYPWEFNTLAPRSDTRKRGIPITAANITDLKALLPKGK